MNRFDHFREQLRQECNLALWRFLDRHERECVSIYGTRWIQFTHPTWRRKSYPNWRHRFYLLEEPPVPFVPWFPCCDALLEFYRVFDGLREMPPRADGHFVPVASVRKVGDNFRADWYPEFMAFRDCPVFFRAANGDAIVQNDGGQFTWLQLETHNMPHCAGRFSELLASWIDHHSGGEGYPFDSHK